MEGIHEFSGSMTYETNFGLESFDFSYNLILAPDADESLLVMAGKSLAQAIAHRYIEEHNGSSHFSEN